MSNPQFPDARRDFMRPTPTPDYDDIDCEVAGDPFLDRLPEYRGHGKIRRVLELLDQIEEEKEAI